MFKIKYLSLMLALPLSVHAIDLGLTLDQHGGSAVRFGVESPKYSRNSEVSFAPASNSKMFTALAVLERLGANATIPTVLQFNQVGDTGITNLRVIGYGDPSYGLSEIGESLNSRVDKMAQALWDAGVRQIWGDVEAVSSDARFENLRYPEGWTADDPNTCDGALAQAFNVNLNCASYRVNSLTGGAWLSSAVNNPVKVQLSSGRSTHIVVGLADPHHPASGFLVKGTLKAGAHPAFVLPVLDTREWVKNLLIASLHRKFAMNSAEVASPGPRREITLNSPPLSLIVKAMMKNSVNLIGDALFKIHALHFGNPGEPDLILNAQQSLRSYLLGAGVPSEFTLYDGAGLSRQSRVTPRALYAFLNYAKDSHAFPAFFASLPIAGVDGTLRGRMKGSAAYNRLRAKTGTLNGVYNLSGFIPSSTGYIPFVLLTSTGVGYSAVARGSEDRFGAALATMYPRGRTPELNEVPFPYVPEHAGQDNQ